LSVEALKAPYAWLVPAEQARNGHSRSAEGYPSKLYQASLASRLSIASRGAGTALLPMAGDVPVLGHIVPELKTRADREADRVAAVLKQIGKQVIVYQIRLHHHAEMFGDIDRAATAESVEGGPFLLHAGRRDGLCTTRVVRKSVG
jgi:hypothetical protein